MVDDVDEEPPNKIFASQSRRVLRDSEGGEIEDVDYLIFVPSMGKDGDLASRIDLRLLKTTDSL
jgi:hypothetical protein